MTPTTDPGVLQGRQPQHHHPIVNLDAVLGVVLTFLVGPALTGVALLAAVGAMRAAGWMQ